MKIYGLIGAQRVGKTTLARDLAEEHGVPFCETRVSQTLASLGVNPQADMAFVDRLVTQERVLQALFKDYQRAMDEHPAAPAVIVDRTPLDVLAYTTAEIQRETLNDPDLMRAVARHENLCFTAMNSLFAGACLVPPGIPLVPDPTKAPANPHYQRHIHATMLEAVVNSRNTVPTFLLGQGNVNRKSRVTDTGEHFITILSQHERSDARRN